MTAAVWRRAARAPLWARLVAGTLLLVTVALAVTGAVGIRLLRGYLLDRVDSRLALAALTVVGDEARLRQVVGNLIANALIHTPAGTPVQVRAGATGQGTVRLEVADQGPGLAAADAERVFERFFRADRHATAATVAVAWACRSSPLSSTRMLARSR